MKIALVVCSIMLFCCACASAEVTFSPSSFPDAKRSAATEHKSMMIDFSTDWCYWCKVLDQKTYTAPEVSAYADAHFISLKINAEKGEGIDLAKKYGVHGYPTILFLDDNGDESYRVVGFEPPDKFLLSMQVAGMGSTAKLETRFKEHPDDAQTAYALAERYNKTNDPAHASEYYLRVVTLDVHNTLHLAEKAALTLAYSSLNAENMGPLESFITTYPAAAAVPDVHKTLAIVYLRKHDVPQSQRHMDVLRAEHLADGELLNRYASECTANELNLQNALIYASDAVGLASDPLVKATYMDTHAEVLFMLKQFKQAAEVEQNALVLLANNPKYARQRGEMQAQLRRFQTQGQ